MHIVIITPAAKKSLNGNRATAQRWLNIFTQLGHTVSIQVEWDKQGCDIMVALHAWRSAKAIIDFKNKYPTKPLILAMTGTDLYRYISTHAETTLNSIALADYLVTLHSLAKNALPKISQHKTHVIHQSAKLLSSKVKRSVNTFDICVVGHLREEKDSLRVAYAVRNLPVNSRIRVLHYGKSHNEEWAEMAHQEEKTNSRYQWLGEVPHWKIRQAYSRCHLMVLPSIMEGGANVISEATIAGLPVIASDIDGSIGLLGENYTGYFPVKNTAALTALLSKAETDNNFLSKLEQQCKQRAALFTHQAEKQAWDNLLNKVKNH